MKLTINEIAKIANVAKSTVSKALNGQKGVSEEKRLHIMELAKTLQYEPSASAQALASNKTGAIGLLVPHKAEYSLSGAYWSAIITSIAQTARLQSYSLMIITPAHDDDISESIESIIRRKTVDGLIIGAEQLDVSVIQLLLDTKMPFVFIGRNSQIQHYSVDVNNREGSERLVSHMINSGYKKIVCLSGPATYLYSQERVEGYLAALSKASISWSLVEHTSYTIEALAVTMARIIQTNSDFDAVYITAGGDFLLDCIDLLKFSGINPKNLGLGAFDDYRFFDYLSIPVCTVRQPLKEIGTRAALLLFDFLKGTIPPKKNYTLDVELILR